MTAFYDTNCVKVLVAYETINKLLFQTKRKTKNTKKKANNFELIIDRYARIET